MTGIFPRTMRLHKYGLNFDELKYMAKVSTSVSDFIDKFSESYLALRGKSRDGIVFEKSVRNLKNPEARKQLHCLT